MNLWKSIAGMMELEITSAEPAQTLEAINKLGIEIQNIRQVNDLTCRVLILRTDYSTVAALCQKRGETLSVRNRAGIYWSIRQTFTRPVMVAFILLFLICALLLPSRIFFVRVEGNQTVPAGKIIEAAQKCGIGFGSSRRVVRSEKVKNALLFAVPELQWAGVNTAGCVAVISVRERSISQPEEKKAEVTSILADRDGYILSVTSSAGEILVKPGQTVKEGQILISGYSDCGTHIRATCSEGEIIAQTNRALEVVMPAESTQKGNIRGRKKKYSLLIQKKRINLWKDSGILDSSCGRMYEEYYITLPGGFVLPVALCVDTYIIYEEQSTERTPEEAEAAMSRFAGRYLIQQMIAGKIQEETHILTLENGTFRLCGNYVCSEMIGRERQEKIGDTNGKSG